MGSFATSDTTTGVVNTTPLTFFSMDGVIRSGNTDTTASIFIKPSPGQLPAISLEVGGTMITLLLDTACSGFVLRPNVVQKLNLSTYATPMTMTAAGGTNTGGGVARIESFRLANDDRTTVTGPFPVAVQDIGALPIGLDGILGISFLSRYRTVNMDFGNGRLTLYETDERNQNRQPVAETEMSRSKLGIYAVDVTLDGKGPVKMLLDTGASCTLLNWKGVSQMGLSSSDDVIRENSSSVGAIGADNVALELTHFYTLERRFNLRSGHNQNQSLPGVSVHGTDGGGGGIKIDVGRIPVLDALESEGVGGILGSDLLMACDLLTLQGMKGPIPKLFLYQ